MIHMKYILQFCIACVLIGFLGCEETTTFQQVKRGKTFFHFFNAHPGYASVDLTVQQYEIEKTAGNNIAFLDSWPNNGYATLATSLDSLSARDAVFLNIREHATKEIVVPPFYTNKLINNGKYTAILVDAGGESKFVIADDNEEFQKGPIAYVRLINVNRFAQSVSFFDKEYYIDATNITFLNATAYREIPVGKRTFYISNDLGGQIIDSIPNLILRAGKPYTIYLTHINGQARAVAKTLE